MKGGGGGVCIKTKTGKQRTSESERGAQEKRQRTKLEVEGQKATLVNEMTEPPAK